MIHPKFKQWLAIGVSEIILSLVLISVAPTFLNSKKPWFGFLIWLTVPTVLVGSAGYGVSKLITANRSRNIFLEAFPEYSYLGIGEFLELSPAHVASEIELLKTVKETTAIAEYNISLFEILEQTQNEAT